jgi:hypothetical protein
MRKDTNTDNGRTDIAKLISDFGNLCERPQKRSHGGKTITYGAEEMPLPTKIYDKLQ